MINKFLVLIISFVIFSQAGFAEKKQHETIFKCINSKGDIYYNDRPCPTKDKEKKIKVAITPKSAIESGVVPVSLSVIEKKAKVESDFQRNENERKDRENDRRAEEGRMSASQP